MSPSTTQNACLNLWPAGAKAEALGALDAMQEGVGAMEHSVEAELHVKSLIRAFFFFLFFLLFCFRPCSVA